MVANAFFVDDIKKISYDSFVLGRSALQELYRLLLID